MMQISEIHSQRDANAELHVTMNVVFQVVMLLLHLLLLASWSLNVMRHLLEPGRLPTGSSAYEMGRRVGQVLALVGSGAWAFVGLIWTPLNAYGLATRRPWAARSTIVYWCFAIIGCCVLPLWAYGLWSLSRPRVRALFRTA